MDQVAHVEACRLCANFYVTGADVEFIHLFEPLTGLEDQLDFVHKQSVAWQLHISADDSLPQRICANCFAQFCNIQTFRQQCLLAEQKLLESFVGVSLAENGPTAKGSKQTGPMSQVANGTAGLSNDNELLNGLKIAAPVSSADLMATLDGLQPPTTSADVIASLDGLQLPASVAETLSILTQELTTMQNGTLLDTSANSITTHATMDTKTEETNVLQLPAASTTQNIYYAQHTPITTVAAGTNKTATMMTNAHAKSVGTAKGEKADIDLEDMLQGSIIPKHSRSNNLQQEMYEEVKEEQHFSREETQQSFSSFEGMVDEDMDCISCSDQDEYNEMEDFEPDADAVSPTRVSRNSFTCQYCYCPNSGSIDHLVFDSSDALSQHFFDVHDPNLPYTCPYCPQKYCSARQRDYHVRLMHPTASKADQCEYCKRILRSPKELHELSCQYVGDWRCDICDQCFYHVPLSRLRTHQRRHTTKNQLKCRVCGRVFIRRANLEAHERMHRPRDSFTIHCDQCQEGFLFSNDYELRRHKYQTHNGALPVRCEYCHKGFVSMAFLSRHTQHFHPDKIDGNHLGAATTCTNCGCAFTSLHKLRMHVQRPRDENGRCIEIMREAVSNQDRTRQLRRPRLHACAHCNKRFTTRAALERHTSTHETTSYSCSACSTRFENANELKRHIMQMHAKPRYLKCDMCEKRFCYMRELQQHQKVHAEAPENNLSCPVLNCGFKSSSTKEAHDHAFVKHKLIACEFCDCLFTRNRLTTHLHTVHAAEVATEEPNNNNNNNSTSQTNALDSQTEDSLAVASILDADAQMNNNDIMVSFEDSAINGGEKVRVELVQQHTPSVGNLVLQEQTSNTFKPLIPTADEMDQNFLMNALLDPDHEIIVT
ncbi:zinc finger protein Xfin-like isoform X1 [Anastrepha ludens]|uniref:zinc finger protein Xfin-like isoform X1 n=1 Tax=Anastrepha ludens TaxID=28586 RepID=UPI0023AF103D|nr:zinc finger protein Xfin-like isoform X1 [Anastrepha ludens]